MGYDIIVVGGGPAGLAASITCSNKGLKTILIEKNSEIGCPVKTSAFTFKDVVDKWNLPYNVMMKWHSSFYLHPLYSGREVEVNFGKYIGGCLDYPSFLKELSYRAIENGVKFILSDAVVGPIMDGDLVIGVKTSKGRKLKSKIVIDGSGPTAIIGKKLGLIPRYSEIEIGIGIEYEMHNVKVRNPESIDFYVGREKVVPIGYGWVFPLSDIKARVGISTVYNTPEDVEEKNIEFWHSKFLGKNSPIYDRVKNGQPYAVHGGAYPLGGMIEKPYSNGVLLAGDAASQASMLVGEGIRYAMEFGKIAAEVSFDAIKNNDVSEEFLRRYIERVKQYLGEYFDVAIDLLKVPTDEYWEALIDAMMRYKSTNPGMILKYLRTEMSYEDAKNIFPSFVGKYLRRK